MHIKLKLGNPGITVAATNPMFDFLITSYDLNLQKLKCLTMDLSI